MKSQVACALVATLLAGPVLAERRAEPGSSIDPAVRPGVRIRFRTGGSPRRTGTVVTVDDRYLVVTLRDGLAARIRLADVGEMQVHAGRRSRVKAGALIGAVPGAVAGGLYGQLMCWDNPECSRLAASAAVALVGGAMTAAVGALVGVAASTDRWEPVATGPHVAVGPVAGPGIGVGLRLTF